MISICGTSGFIDEVVDADFDGDWIGVTPITRAGDLIGRILSGFDADVDLIGGDGA